MCGLVLLHGPRAHERVEACTARLAHRGPDEQRSWSGGETALGFARLAINGEGLAGRQPHEHGGLLAAINGEIYNHRALRSHHGLPSPGGSDTAVVLPLLARLGPGVIDELNGFYSGVVLDPARGELRSLRDHMGKKPLLLGYSGSELFVTSELSALDRVDRFEPLPLGLCRIDLGTGEVVQERAHRDGPAPGELRTLVETAVLRRLPSPSQPMGVFLSGGLDSSIVAALVARHRPDAIFYVLADPGSPDHRYAKRMVEALGLERVRWIPLPDEDALPALVEAVVRSTESFNPSIVSNGLCTWLLSRAARADGLKVVLTGEGADELFCGYHRFGPDDPWRQTRARLIADMHATELRRLDSCSMAHGIEARCPFLDRAVRAHADSLDYADLYRRDTAGITNKLALRVALGDLLPAEIAERRKTSFDVGSGVRGMVVRLLRGPNTSESEALEAIWRRCFPWEPRHPWLYAYPVFDHVIATRGASHR
jgi:asparagine synthase (glutamine-hydrolysing)